MRSIERYIWSCDNLISYSDYKIFSGLQNFTNVNNLIWKYKTNLMAWEKFNFFFNTGSIQDKISKLRTYLLMLVYYQKTKRLSSRWRFLLYVQFYFPFERMRCHRNAPSNLSRVFFRSRNSEREMNIIRVKLCHVINYLSSEWLFFFRTHKITAAWTMSDKRPW